MQFRRLIPDCLMEGRSFRKGRLFNVANTIYGKQVRLSTQIPFVRDSLSPMWSVTSSLIIVG